MAILFCTQCWAQNPVGARRCTACRAPLRTLEGGYVDKLISALNHPVPETVQLAASILGQRRESRAVGPLLRLLGRTDEPGALESALEALGKIGDPQAIQLIRRHVRRWPLRARREAVSALRSIGGPEARRIISALAVGDPSPTVRGAAHDALRSPGRQDSRVR